MKILLIVLCAAALGLSGCALFDSIVGEREEQAVSDDGKPLYEKPDGSLTTDPVNPATGVPNAPRMLRVVTGHNLEAVGAFVSNFGPWGAAIGGLIAAGAGGIRAWRNGKKAKLAEAGAKFAVNLVEKIKQGDAVDADKDGKISLGELQAWVAKQGQKFIDPEYLRKLVIEANKALA